MGFVFQLCDRTLSKAMGAPTVPYGEQLMESPRASKAATPADPVMLGKVIGKAVMAPVFSGMIESGVANRAEAQRFYGLDKFKSIEKRLGWNALARFCGPGFAANASRNFVMCSVRMRMHTGANPPRPCGDPWP